MKAKKDLIKSCDILLYKGKGFKSWLIQWGTGSPYNHVAIVVEPTIHLGIESDLGHQSGVRAFDLRKLEGQSVHVYRVKEGFGFDRDQVVSFLVGHLGAKYDLLGVFFLGILKAISLLTGFTLKLFNPLQKAKDYFCSELCYEAFKQADLDIVPQVPEADVTSPGDIAQSERLERIKLVGGL